MANYRYGPGDRPFADYTIEYALGRGGFGEVYYATDSHGREVALKAILNHEEVELRGVKNCMNLDSPRLISICDLQRDEHGVLWIVMEYIRGPSLQEIISQFPDGVGTHESAFLLRELAIALSDLHNAGVVHRDLKPSNAFLVNGRVKLGDFSLSKSMSSQVQSQHTITVGSVHYMAPEISQGRYDKSVDIYALGVILHELLTGRPPYDGESVGEILMKHLQGKPDLEHVVPCFLSSIQHALQTEPADRFATAEDFAKAVESECEMPKGLDSFRPATLSMIGEKVRKPPAMASTHVPRDTVQRPRTAVSVELRSLWAFASIMLLIIFATLANNRAGLGPVDAPLFALAAFVAGIWPAYVFERWLPVAPRSAWRQCCGRLVTAGFAAAILVVTSVACTEIEIEGLAIAALSALVAFGIIDWPRLLKRKRDSIIQWDGTLGAGFIAIVLCFLLKFEAWWLFAATTSIGLTIPLQFLGSRDALLKSRHAVDLRNAASQELAL